LPVNFKGTNFTAVFNALQAKMFQKSEYETEAQSTTRFESASQRPLYPGVALEDELITY
jgi:hypothetical protein